MSDTDLLKEVKEIRKLLELMAEPAIAQRDAKLRAELLRIVGASPKKQQAVVLMDGSRAQKDIITQTSVNGGHLSTMVGQLEDAKLLADGKKHPKLVISIPTNFFEAK